jgi:hypothetical protein
MRLIELAWIGGLLMSACGGASGQSDSGAAGGENAGAGGSVGASGGSNARTGGGWGTGGGPAPTGGTTYSGGSGGDGPTVVTVCPETPPTDKAPCRSGLSCSYGDDPRPSCRARYDCHDSVWVATAGTCDEITNCNTFPQFPYDGRTCAEAGSSCWAFNDAYNFNVECTCGSCSGTTCTMTWDCGGVPAPGCPRAIPNLGQPCDSTTPAKCIYGLCPQSTVALCQGGVWTWTDAVCQ